MLKLIICVYLLNLILLIFLTLISSSLMKFDLKQFDKRLFFPITNILISLYFTFLYKGQIHIYLSFSIRPMNTLK